MIVKMFNYLFDVSMDQSVKLDVGMFLNVLLSSTCLALDLYHQFLDA